MLEVCLSTSNLICCFFHVRLFTRYALGNKRTAEVELGLTLEHKFALNMLPIFDVQYMLLKMLNQLSQFIQCAAAKIDAPATQSVREAAKALRVPSTLILQNTPRVV